MSRRATQWITQPPANPKAKLTDQDILDIVAALNHGWRSTDLARRFNRSLSHISLIKRIARVLGSRA